MAHSLVRPLLSGSLFALVFAAPLVAHAAEMPERALLAARTPPAEKRSPAADREAILDRLRCEGEDPSTCFWGPSFYDADAATVARDVSAEEVEQLLAEVLGDIDAHDDALLEAALEEAEEEAARQAMWFGSEDHHVDPSIDIYDNPVAALTSGPDLHLDAINPADFDIPLVINERVKDWMVYFLTRGRKYYTRWLGRAQRYEPLIRPALAEAGLPQDLLYQSMIESGFNPYATSSAKAVGVWQFIEATGKRYGMAIDFWIDERRDPVLATGAAIRYLRDLYKRFGAWELATAGYNAGEGKIERAIGRYGTRDFWELSSSERSYLKPETKNYVAKIMAAAILGKYPERYGLTKDILDADRLTAWDFDRVSVPEATDVSLIARAAGTTEERILEINPQLKRFCTPPGIANYQVNVPKGSGAQFAENLAKIPPEERTTFARHKVRKGESLSKIAQNYGVSSDAILKLNQLSSSKSVKTGAWLVVPVRAVAASGVEVHVVAEGETLGGIAGKYKQTIEDLKSWNKLKSDDVQVGQKIKVISPSAIAKAAAEDDNAGTEWGSHKVRDGESLGRIAQRYGMGLSELKEANSLRSDRIQVGQKLKVRVEAQKKSSPTDAAASTAVASSGSYTVRSGDVLGEIAQKHGMTTEELRSLNGLKGNLIYAGQDLKVRGGTEASGASEPVAQKASRPAEQAQKVHYVVKSGDTGSGIAARHGVSWETIRRANDLDDDELRVGEKLVIPGAKEGSATSGGTKPKASGTKTYKVKDGDTLWGIARANNVSVSDIKAWNRMRGSSLKVGQVLKIETD